MDELEQQIRAWGDAMAPSPSAPVDPAETAAAIIAAGRAGGGDDGSGGLGGANRRRWVLAIAAVLLVIAGIAVVLQQTGEPPAEQLRTGTTSSTSTTDPPPAEPVPFELLASSSSTWEDPGTLHAVQDAGSLAERWYSAGQLTPIPEVDLDRNVVVSITTYAEPCMDLVGFERRGTVVEPQFRHGSDGQDCEASTVDQRTYLASLAWSDLDGQLDLRLPAHEAPFADHPEEAYDEQRLQADRVTNPPVTATMELVDTTIASGGEVAGKVTIVNTSGAPIETTRCFGFDGPWIVQPTTNEIGVQPRTCGPTTVPEGESSYPITVRARYWACEDPNARLGPYCDEDGLAPPLPAGEYQVILFRDPTGAVPSPAPIAITITG